MNIEPLDSMSDHHGMQFFMFYSCNQNKCWQACRRSVILNDMMLKMWECSKELSTERLSNYNRWSYFDDILWHFLIWQKHKDKTVPRERNTPSRKNDFEDTQKREKDRHILDGKLHENNQSICTKWKKAKKWFRQPLSIANFRAKDGINSNVMNTQMNVWGID